MPIWGWENSNFFRWFHGKQGDQQSSYHVSNCVMHPISTTGDNSFSTPENASSEIFNMTQVCFWNVKNSCYSNTRSPSSIRRRVMAPPSMECRKLFMDEEPVEHQKGSNSTNSITMPQLGTPKCQKKNFSSELYSKETLEKTPEALLNSPSSVLNPPSSLKRKTIRDYFIAPS